MKITIRDNYRLEVFPDLWQRSSHESKMDAARKLKKEILRHCDSLERNGTRIVFDLKEICQFCKSEWEVCEDGCPDCPKGEPLCCGRAVEEFNFTKEKP